MTTVTIVIFYYYDCYSYYYYDGYYSYYYDLAPKSLCPTLEQPIVATALLTAYGSRSPSGPFFPFSRLRFLVKLPGSVKHARSLNG